MSILSKIGLAADQVASELNNGVPQAFSPKLLEPSTPTRRLPDLRVRVVLYVYNAKRLADLLCVQMDVQDHQSAGDTHLFELPQWPHRRVHSGFDNITFLTLNAQTGNAGVRLSSAFDGSVQAHLLEPNALVVNEKFSQTIWYRLQVSLYVVSLWLIQTDRCGCVDRGV